MMLNKLIIKKMKKYKLIKEYPGSPKLGYIWEMYSGYKGDYHRQPEYWEEIIEKDYEILSLTIHDSRLSDVTGYGNAYIEALLKDRLNKIHSVRRISDGEIFTIGDNVIFSAKSGSVLKGSVIQFRIDTEFGIIVDYIDNSKGVGQHWNYLNNAEKYKQPLFTTEDGVDIFEGDDYYSIHTTQFNFPNGYGKPTIKGTAIKGYWITFSTKEAAEEYVLMNKPCLSIQDLINHTKEEPNIRRISPRGLKAFKNLVKQKLNQRKVIDITTNIVYDSISIAAEKLDINVTKLYNNLRNNKTNLRYYE